MNFMTHITMANLIFSEVKELYELNRVAFIYGNVMPDVDPRFNKTPHMFDNDLERILALSEELVTGDFSVNTYSVRLGFLCHYICDFFCLYHSEISKFIQYREHGIYEIKLHFVLKKMLRFQFFKTMGNDFTMQEEGSMRTQIMRARERYVESPKTYENDLFYAIQTSIYACKVITDSMVYRGNFEIYPQETLWTDYI
ncbi:zinc dependent phospholipase C family protein [Fusibacter ferrireducens]|uniref:Zinc dependent phospholipase C family protein n=1 Tax=Fusibacter ferrireducens TaxID=2785058 RepID=A0ABR9ZV04_9FIRM|nr:zinc dependent phospholipase C family protein [Fusibacter ferrireducens]MBF4694265.1 zinc dependent phospholipase C family protein [Fusibacter ferrireducens]